MSQTKEKLLDIFYFETSQDITFYSTFNDNKITLLKNAYTFTIFQNIKDKYNFISLVWESQGLEAKPLPYKIKI